jgi:allantoicase
LDIHPDGGVARFRAYGEVVPDPALLTPLEVVDLAALEYGGVVVAASDSHYGSPVWLLAPGPPRDMSEGWETARRRTPGHEWVQVRLGVPGRLRLLELDTTHYLHNAPAAVEVSDGAGRPLLAYTTIAPDTRARFPVDAPADELILRIHPDGGVARVRAWGTPTDAGLAQAWARWEQTGAAGMGAAGTGTSR